MFKYPLKYRFRSQPDLIVEFSCLTAGRVIRAGVVYKAGEYVEGLCPHTNSSTWELMEAESEYYSHDGIANRILELIFLSGACDTEPTALRESIESLLYDYTITPVPEPVYEWQWKYRQQGSTMWQGFTGFLTDDDFKNFYSLHLCPITSKREYEKDESTKRVRQ